MKIKTAKQECWTYWIRDDAHDDKEFQYERKRGNHTGKYLFFSADRNALINIVRNEIEHNGFSIGKISNRATGTDFVLCLYWRDDSRKVELARKYSCMKSVRYRWWKSDDDTIAGKYSEKFINLRKNE